MTTRQEIEDAVRQLPPEELESFRAWFADFDAAIWDRKFESDAATGRLDCLAEEAIQDLTQGRCKPL